MEQRPNWEDIPWGQMDTLDQLVHLSRYFGSDPGFVLAGGGNTSAKIGDVLYIKASGVELADIRREGFLPLSRERVARTLVAPLPTDPMRREEEVKRHLLEARLKPESGQRPSVESVLHELIERRFVVHTHPTLVNGLTCSRDAKAIAQQLFGDEALWVDYCDPGYMLAKSVARAVKRYERRTRGTPGIILLQNHGLIVAAEDVYETKRLTDKVVQTISQRVGREEPERAFLSASLGDSASRIEAVKHLSPSLRGMLAAHGLSRVVAYDGSLAAAFACSQQNRAVALAGALTPDQVVYCKSLPLWLKAGASETPDELRARLRRQLGRYIERYGYEPRVVLIEEVGLLAVAETPKTARAAMAVYLDSVKISAIAATFGVVRALSNRQRQFIENWESEHYRRQVGAGPGSGRANGKVVVITGAAQGLGEAMARDMAAQGAYVVIADTNLQRAQGVSDELNALHGQGRTFAWRTDVTQGESVCEMVSQTIRQYGGIDILISNAGVLRAGSVKTMSDADFNLVTDVNYRGYFHCVKQAAPIMATQHAYNPNCWTDIILIGSKSGLVGSNRNAAYAGSKFGGIGLTQSFALELVEDGIKVNCVCPGNLFDSPLWSDPENGLFVQYLRAGKVPGAKTVADVRKAYEAQVPMRRGCEPADIMAAVYYLIEQRYETGQALPVTGGQVMLR